MEQNVCDMFVGLEYKHSSKSCTGWRYKENTNQ